jgi:uncharacterized OsmC-like protein
MAVAKPKTVVTMKLEGSCPSHSRTDILVRDTETVIDEPVERDGTNLGPTPTETAVAALAGCTNVIANKIARKHGIVFQSMHVAIETQFDRLGVTLQKEIDLPFKEIRQVITVTTDANAADVKRVESELPKYCPLAKLFRQAGTSVVDEWIVNRI